MRIREGRGKKERQSKEKKERRGYREKRWSEAVKRARKNKKGSQK